MKFIEDYQKKLNDIYQAENLICLSDWEIVKFGDKNTLQFLSENCSTTRSRVNADGAFDLITDDLISSISQDIKFSIGNIYLWKELGINNFLNERIVSDTGKTVFTYRQNLADRRFLFYVNVCFEKLYSFWDRIGDILCLSFNLPVSDRDIYFSRVIEELGKTKSGSTNFRSLNDFRNGEYKEVLNRIRKLIVHFRQKDTYFRSVWLKNLSDEEAIKKLQQEKEELPTLLKNQMRLTIKGFENAVLLVGENQ